MPLLIDNDVAQQVLDMPSALEALETAFAEEARGRAVNRTKSILHVPHDEPDFWYNYVSMEGAVRCMHVAGIRIRSDVRDRRTEVLPGQLPKLDEKFAGEPGKYCGLILLFSTFTGELIAILPDGFIQHMRVAATSALSVKYLARPESNVLGILGSGGMARTHAIAFSIVRPVNKIKVFSPTKAHREDFAREMTALLEIEVIPVDRPEEAVRGSDLVAACTNWKQVDAKSGPPLRGAWLEPGQHITVTSGEADDEVVSRLDCYARYNTGPAQHYHTSRLKPLESAGSSAEDYEQGKVDPDKVVWLPDLIIGKLHGRSDDAQITYFTSEGTGVQFVATAMRAYEQAKAKGLGRELPADWFLQTIKD